MRERVRLKLRPTGLWILFGPILGCMWLAAINYSNNLVYAILYLIASLTFVSVFYTRRNCSDLELAHLRLHSGFAGDTIRAEICLENPLARPVYGLVFAAAEKKVDEKRYIPLKLPNRAVLTFGPGEQGVVEAEFPAGTRGRREIVFLQVRSSYPFGLICAAVEFTAPEEFFVYPKAQGRLPLPLPQQSGADGLFVPAFPGDDFAGVRNYSPGENLRHVDWKAFARGRSMMIKYYSGGNRPEVHLDDSTLRQLPWEERLSQLAAWVLEADRDTIPFSLRIGDKTLPTGSGPDHRRLALEFLARAQLDLG